jgi:uncharacterized membrane protein YeaQ/YmgE (transglycosylase-associated protein family)
MSVEALVLFLLVGLAAGWLSGLLVKGSGFGLTGNLIVGVIGAILGAFVFRLIGLSAHGLLAQLICALVGALALTYLLRFVKM